MLFLVPLMMWFLSFIQMDTFLSEINFCFFNKSYDRIFNIILSWDQKLQSFRDDRDLRNQLIQLRPKKTSPISHCKEELILHPSGKYIIFVLVPFHVLTHNLSYNTRNTLKSVWKYMGEEVCIHTKYVHQSTKTVKKWKQSTLLDLEDW